MIDNTDPALIGFELDLGNITAGGADPLKYFQRCKGRVFSLHIKDHDAALHPVDLGTGVVPVPMLIRRAVADGITRFFVEDERRGAGGFAAVKTAFEYLHNINV